MKKNIRVLLDMPELKLINRKLGPFEAGDEVELWAWDATVLERHGIAAPVQKPPISELRRQILAEERSIELAPLSEDFYSEVARNISTLRAAGDFEKAEELKAQTLALLEIRLPKLVRLALSPEGKSLPLEEHFLINRLASVVENWTQRLSESFEEAGEEVEKNELGGPIRHAAGDEADIQKPRVPAPKLHT
ncbi:MAG: hypothetical protein QMD95_03015 [Candidatus Hodarchaeaceae archaeon]|nr:hypothetical protein [Candidatus Hodarchaeaceae archaeon]